MEKSNYLQWLSSSADPAWWHDSADPKELQQALGNGAVGVTTKSVLCAQALNNNKEYWAGDIPKVLATAKHPSAKAEALMGIVIVHASRQLEPIHRSTGGPQGYVCAQIIPSLGGNREAMYEMTKRFGAWAPNFAVTLPATTAGLVVTERICAEGTAATITVSFSVPQAFVTGRRYQELANSRKAGEKIGKCFAVIMIGRLDDYLREVFADNQENIKEEEVHQVGLSVVKRATWPNWQEGA